MEVLTIGYQRANADQVIATLKARGVQKLIDTRHNNRRGRKHEFFENNIRPKLEAAGIEYDHDPDFGSPTAIQAEFNLKGCLPPTRAEDLAEWMDSYSRWLEENPKIVQKLRDKIGNQVVCLLCYEADSSKCHRSRLCRALEQQFSFTVQHLTVH
jgi:uncharacterized protein (DUF488 family)